MGDQKARIRVILVEDQGLQADGFQSALEYQPDMELVKMATNGPDGLRLIEELAPDVALVDLALDHSPFDGVELIRRAKAKGLPTRLLAITSFIKTPLGARALEAHADGLLSRHPRMETVLNAIRLVARDCFVLGPMSELGEWFQGVNVRAEQPVCPLTERQREIVQLIAEDLTNEQIAGRLFLSEGTVRAHVSNILEAMHVRSRLEAVSKARQEGWLT